MRNEVAKNGTVSESASFLLLCSVFTRSKSDHKWIPTLSGQKLPTPHFPAVQKCLHILMSDDLFATIQYFSNR